MMPELEKYWHAVQNTVCKVCIDSDPYGNGICRVSEMSMCGVKEYFPKIANIILSIKSDKMDDYILALRENICKECRETPAGVCELRNSVECALDRYFPLIVQAIESVNK